MFKIAALTSSLSSYDAEHLSSYMLEGKRPRQVGRTAVLICGEEGGGSRGEDNEPSHRVLSLIV